MCIKNRAKDEHPVSITLEVTHTFNPTTWKAVNVRPAWVTQLFQLQSTQSIETLSQRKNKQTKRTKCKSVKYVTNG